MHPWILRDKAVKNEEAEQEIKQDGIKPEENGAIPEESAETTEGEEKERISPSDEKPAELSAEENKPVKSPNSPAAEAPPTTDHAPSGTPTEEEVEKPKEAEKPAEEPAVNAQNEEEEEEDVPDDAESHETDKRDDVGDSKPADEAVSDAGKDENI